MLKRSLSLWMVLSAFAGMAAGQPGPSVSFIDRWGEDASRFVEYDFARVRLTDPSLDVSGDRDTVDVIVSSALGPDQQTVTLTETGKRTGVFEGGIDLRLNAGSPAFSWALETAGTPTSFDTIQVDADGGLSDTAEVVPSILRLVDDAGHEMTNFAAGGRVFVRLIDRHSDTPNPDTTTVTLTTSGGDSEVVTLAETAVSGGELKGSIQSRIAEGAPTPGDGVLDTLAGETLSASHADVNGVSSSTATAAFAGITLRFVDSRGVPTTTVLEGAKITLQAISASANLDYLVVEQIPATLTSELGGDSETLTLVETGTSTGVFEGRMRVTGYAPVTPGNTDIQVSPSLPVPETIEASAPGAAPVTIHPSGSSTRLLDVWGNDAETFPRGGTLRVRVEDPMIDTPFHYVLQSTGVRLRSLTTGDEEHLILDETGIGSNVYERSLSLETGPAIPGDGKLQAQTDGEILEARHEDWNAVTVSTDTGRLSPAELWFLDDDGSPTETVLENGTLRLRLFDSLRSTPGAADVTSEIAGDGENLFLSAVPDSPGSFEGSMPVEHMTWGTPTGNDILSTRYDDNSLDGLDTIRAYASSTSVSARAAYSEIRFADAHGNEAESFAIGETLHVRLRSGAPGTPGADQIQILLLSQTTGDSETMTLTETGPGTNVYEGSFPTGTGTALPGNGRLQVQIGETVAAEDDRADRPVAFVLDTAVITANRVTFVDRQNAPTGVVFRHGRARFEAFDLAANTASNEIDTRSVTVLSYAEGNGRLVDLETLDLIETGPDTALFRGSIRVSSNTASTFGVLDTSFYSPYEGLDRLRVEILGGSSDTAELTDAVIRFLDGQGNDASIYQAGDPIHIRLIREASNLSPVMVDGASVFLSSWLGRSATSESYDGLSLSLTETGPDTGVFEGEIEATAAPANFDSIFQVRPGGEIRAVIAGDWAEDADLALIADGGVTPENDPPMAGYDFATVDEGSSVQIDVLANDSDPNGDNLSIVSFTQGTKGSVTASGAGLLYTPNPNSLGEDSFTYTIQDSSGATDTAIVSVTITEVNEPPVAVADNIALNEDTPQGFLLLTNDFDPDGDTLTISSATNGSHGSTIRFSTSVFYAPAANWSGTDTFTYTVSDGKGGTATATVFVTVNPVNDVPVAGNDSATTPEDTPVTINVLANDSDVDGDPLTIASRTNGAKGTVTINAGASVTYTPNLNATGADSFTYTVSDGKGGTKTATVTVTIFAVNDPPNAGSDARTTPEDTAVNIAILANDSDPEGQTLTVTAVTQGANGSVVLNADKTVTYTPNLNFIGSDLFTYTVSDGSLTATANVSVTMTAVNDPPYAVEDEITLAEDGTISFYVLGNDSDPEGDTIYVASVLPAKNGVVSGPGLNQVLTYTPKPNFHGQDFFVYTVKDTNFGTNSATVLITVTPVEDPPVAVNDAATVAEDAPATAINVLANDTDPDGGSISITSVTQPANGAVVITGGGMGLTYQPNANFCTPGAPDTFTYTLSPGGSTATVSVTVACADDNPVAVVDAATVAEDSSPNAINVLANDADLDGGPISIQSVTQPANGTVVITNGGADLAYTPNANFCGTPDTFTYTLSPGGSTAAVSMTVTCVNDAPVLDLDANDDQGTAGNDFAVTFTEGDAERLIEDPLDATVTDVDSETLESLTVTITNLLDIGSETLSVDVTGTSITADYVLAPGTGALTLTGPDTMASFQAVLRTVRYLNTDADPDATPRAIHFVANDGSVDSNTAVSTVTLVPVDTEPTAVDDASTVNEDSVTSSIDVLANDADPDGGPISITSVTQPANGTVVITGGGTGLTYQPNANFCTSGAPETFTYMLTPGGSAATVSVTVTCVNDAPDAVNDSASTNEDNAVTVSVLANDSDLDGDALSVSAVTQGTKGTVAINANGTATYTPAPNTFGADAFTYTVSDGNGGSDIATVTVSVAPVNDAPVAVADTATTREGAAVTVAVLANDSDLEGNTLSVTSLSALVGGTAVVNGGNTVTYTAGANFNGTGSFTYTLSDGQGGTATGTVAVTVKDALERVAVLGTHGVWIQTGADVLSGDVIVNQTGATPFLDAGSSELSIAGTVTTPAGYDVQANRINVASGTAVASDAFYNQRTGAGTVTGAQTSPLALPVFATLPSFLTATPGTTDVSVGVNGTRTLAAGSYRDLIVGRRGTVTFTGGTYHFRNVQVDRDAKLFFSAASTVRVQQKMSVLQTSTIKPATGATIDGSDIVFHIAGANGTTGTLTATPKSVEIGVDGVVWANLYAPNGTIWIKDRTEVRGVLLGKDVQVGPNVQVTLDSSFTGQ